MLTNGAGKALAPVSSLQKQTTASVCLYSFSPQLKFQLQQHDGFEKLGPRS